MSVLTRPYKPKSKAPWESHVPLKPKPSAMCPHPVQAKLTIGQSNDMYEQEADRLADHVMRMTDDSLVQRQPLAENTAAVISANFLLLFLLS